MQLDITELLKNATGGEDGILPDPDLLTYYKNLEDRTIWIDYDVDTSLLEVGKQIIRFNQNDKDIPVENRKPIKLFIFSYGGDLDACYTVLDLCMASKTPIWTINAGVAMSAGLLLLLAGDRRFTFYKSQALIHSGSAEIGGTYEQTQEANKNYKQLVSIMQDFILERTKIDRALYGRKKNKEWYLSAVECVSMGVVDAIVNDLDEII